MALGDQVLAGEDRYTQISRAIPCKLCGGSMAFVQSSKGYDDAVHSWPGCERWPRQGVRVWLKDGRLTVVD